MTDMLRKEPRNIQNEILFIGFLKIKRFIWGQYKK